MLSDERKGKLDLAYEELDVRIHNLMHEKGVSLSGMLWVLDKLTEDLAEELKGVSHGETED